MPELLSVYHRLPPHARSAMVAAHGLRLRWWRYGRDTETLVAAALARDAWTEPEWEDWRRDRLRRLLQRSAAEVPYYREQWRERRRGGDDRPVEDLANWPPLEKDEVRREPRAFVADHASRPLYRDGTSGSTGTPLSVWSGRGAQHQWYALYEARTRRWHGVSRHEPWAIVGGQLVVPPASASPPYWVWNAPLRQLYLSAFHLTPRTIADYAAAMAEREITHLVGYTAAVAVLARLAVDAAVTLPRLRVVITNAEPVFPAQRAVIERAFGSSVRETYGVGELVIGASECERGELHLWPEAGTVEVVRGERDEAAPAGEVGDLLATGLVNPAMPLIRYRVGDRAALAPGWEPCMCGRRLPRLASVEGRLEDQVVTLDGRQVGRFDAVFKGDLKVREAQVVQVGVADVVVRVVPAAGFDAATGRVLARRMRDRLGDVRVSIDLVDTIERGAAGKFRAVVSAIDRRERSELGHRRGQSPVEEAAGPPEDEAIGDRRDDEEVQPRGG